MIETTSPDNNHFRDDNPNGPSTCCSNSLLVTGSTRTSFPFTFLGNLNVNDGCFEFPCLIVVVGGGDGGGDGGFDFGGDE